MYSVCSGIDEPSIFCQFNCLMAKYLIDANLPYYFGLWNNPAFMHVSDLNDSWSDDLIWNYAHENDLIIITKDADFSVKVLCLGPPPKVIHLKFL